MSSVDSQSVVSDAPRDEPSDRDLILRFAEQRDEDAFAGLVSRHGPLVMSVCRRVLPNEHDAMDAFQASFLVLAQKARTVRWQTSLANWLYGVGYRCAQKAAARIRSRRERPLDGEEDLVRCCAFCELTSRESQRTLLDELHRLPSRYRSPLILCYLEGKTQEEAGLELGCSTAAVKGRLRRGRQKLRRQLALRGVVFSFAMGAIQLSAKQAESALTGSLVASTTTAAVGYATGLRGAHLFSSDVVDLAKGGLKTMTLTAWLGGLVAAALVGVAMVWCIHAMPVSLPASGGDLHAEERAVANSADPAAMALVMAVAEPDQNQGDVPSVEAVEKELVDTAKKAYEAALAAFEAGVTDGRLESVCQWSRQWLDAELSTSRDEDAKLRALKAHVERMKRMHDQAEAQYRVRTGDRFCYSAAAFFYVEARLLVLRHQKGKQPGL